MIQKFADFLQAVKAWAETQDSLLSVAIVGSVARGTARPDSDVDLVLITSDLARYLDDRAWVAQLGQVIAVGLEDWGLVQSLRVFYAGGLEVEFGLTTSEWAAVNPVDTGTAQVIRSGFQILLDKTGLLAAVVAAINETPSGGG